MIPACYEVEEWGREVEPDPWYDDDVVSWAEVMVEAHAADDLAAGLIVGEWESWAA